jgi:hypothetical protein
MRNIKYKPCYYLQLSSEMFLYSIYIYRNARKITQFLPLCNVTSLVFTSYATTDLYLQQMNADNSGLLKYKAGSSVSIVSGRPGFDLQQRQRTFSLTSASRPALGPIQAPVQWVPGALSPGIQRGRGVMLTTHPLLEQRLRKSRGYTSSPSKRHPWRVVGPLTWVVQKPHRTHFI